MKFIHAALTRASVKGNHLGIKTRNSETIKKTEVHLFKNSKIDRFGRFDNLMKKKLLLF